MKKAFIVVGLQYGDETKGATVDYLAHKFGATLNVRFNGGSQAGHHVTLSNGRVHCFSQFGSGTFNGAHTYISQYVRVDPQAMMNEAQHLEQLGMVDPFSKVHIHKDALIITPYHRHASKRNATVHNRGTTGMGVGECLRFAEKYPNFALRMGDLRHNHIVQNKMYAMAGIYGEEVSELLRIMYASFASQIHTINDYDWQNMKEHNDTIIFEGSQGFGIDMNYGTKPYVTSSDCTANNARELIGDTEAEVTTIGCSRIYAIRHGPGPFPSESKYYNKRFYDPNNLTDAYRGSMRYGLVDFGLMKQAIVASEVNYLSISHLDEWARTNDAQGSSIEQFLSAIQEITGCKIAITANGPTREDRQWLI